MLSISAISRILRATLGDGLVLARIEDGWLFVLNPSAAALWDLHANGLDTESISTLLTQRFGLAEDIARTQVNNLVSGWRGAGLIDAAEVPPAASGNTVEANSHSFRYHRNPDAMEGEDQKRPCNMDTGDPCQYKSLMQPYAAQPAPKLAGALRLEVSGTVVGLYCDDAALRSSIAALVQPLRPDAANPVDHWLHLVGTASTWHLWLDGTVSVDGAGADAAIVAVVSALVELGCRSADRLLVIHGAGLVLSDGRGLLLIAPGGSGKTTLSAALNADGYGLLGDDVVPVNHDGTLAGLGTPICLKAGSWPILSSRRPDIGTTRVVQRFGQPVRYLSPHGLKPVKPCPLGLMLFPRYRPGSSPCIEPLTPEAALQGIVEAESVIRNLDQTKLENLVCWVNSAPAYVMTYPNLDSGLALIRQLVSELHYLRQS